MANALNSGGVFQSYYAGKDDAAVAQERNALAGMRRTQFDQQQGDRRKQMLREEGLQFYAGITQQETPEQRAQVYSQWRPAFVAQYPEAQQFLPEQYDDQAFGQLGFRLLPPEVAQKVVESRYAPRQAADVPSDVREWEYFTGLKPDQQQQYLSMKRASRTVDLGDRQAVLGPTGNIVQSYDKAPPVSETPEYKQRQAEAAARGKALGEVEEKRPALDSFGIAKTAMLDSIAKTPTGGWMGLRGKAGAATTNYQDARQFEQRMQQLSTEIRTVFRIPGEGTLTNQEQQQYGIQLPDIRNDKEVNEQIMRELEARVMARMRMPQAEPVAPAQGGGVSEGQTATNPQTGEKIQFRNGQWVPAQ